jgi:hypothetical protein
VNKLLKMHRQMSDMMKKMGKGGRMPFGGLAACRNCRRECFRGEKISARNALANSREGKA